MLRLLIICLLAISHCTVFSQPPNVALNGCEINGQVHQNRNIRPLTYLGLPVYYDNGIYVDLPRLQQDYPCYRAIASTSSYRLCLAKGILGICNSYSPTTGTIYSFNYSTLNCPLDDFFWIFGILFGCISVGIILENKI